MSQEKKKGIIFLVSAIVLCVILVIVGFLGINNKSFAFPETIKISKVKTHNDSVITFEDSETLAFNIKETTPTTVETHYYTITFKPTYIRSALKGKKIQLKLVQGTDGKTFPTTLKEMTISESDLNKTFTLVDHVKLTTNNTYYQVIITVDGEEINIQEENIGGVLDIQTDRTYDPFNYSYTGTNQTFTAPIDGAYRIQLWGAQGNYYNGDDQSGKNFAGQGAYTAGTIQLKKGETLYLYLGQNQADTQSHCAASFNAGSSTLCDKLGGHYMSAGGGASDVRLVGGAWNDAASLRSRIMVAGGGGGTLWQDQPSFTQWGWGGDAGGLIGYQAIPEHYNKENGQTTYYDTSQGHYYATGGTQTAGGQGGGVVNVKDTNGSAYLDGKFGIGGNGGSKTYVANYTDSPILAPWGPVVAQEGNMGGGGGGGYYGGGGGSSSTDCHSGGGGGSSFISGHTGAVAVDASGNPKAGCTTSTTDNSCSIHYSGKYFTDTVMIDGAGYAWTNVRGGLQQMPDQNGGYKAPGEGSEGSGAAVIAYMPSGNDSQLSESIWEKKQTQTVVIKYHDDEGNELAEDVTLTGIEGETYEGEFKEFEHYTFISNNKDELKGTYNQEYLEVILIYKENEKGKVVFKYEDEDGNELYPPKEIEDYKGEDYETEVPIIDDYILISDNEDDAVGTIIEDYKEVIFVYRKLPNPSTGDQGILPFVIGGILAVSVIGGGVYYLIRKNKK